MASTSYRISITRVLACSLLWPGCQSHLHRNEATNAVSAAKMMVDASTQTPESSLSLPSAHTGKRAASELSRPDTEEKKESPVMRIQRTVSLGLKFRNAPYLPSTYEPHGRWRYGHVYTLLINKTLQLIVDGLSDRL
jgi:hypothetical protein